MTRSSVVITCMLTDNTAIRMPGGLGSSESNHPISPPSIKGVLSSRVSLNFRVSRFPSKVFWVTPDNQHSVRSCCWLVLHPGGHSTHYSCHSVYVWHLLSLAVYQCCLVVAREQSELTHWVIIRSPLAETTACRNSTSVDLCSTQARILESRQSRIHGYTVWIGSPLFVLWIVDLTIGLMAEWILIVLDHYSSGFLSPLATIL